MTADNLFFRLACRVARGTGFCWTMDGMNVSASMLIRRGPTEIFAAFVDPDWLCRFWLDAASAPLAPGAVVQWRFKVPGANDTVTVTRFEAPRRLTLRFSAGLEADFRFDFHDGDATRVSVTCTGFPEHAPLSQATDTVEGFSLVISDLKILLETGRSANLVRDKAELVARARAEEEARGRAPG
jgi:uncharacterized protein YndB with AHSA1/START domain